MENPYTLLLQGKEVPAYHFLTDNGLVSGTVPMKGNYLAADKHFFYKAMADEVFVIKKFSVHIQDAGNLDAGSYGNNIALTNGIRIVIATGSDLTNVIQEFTNGDPVRTNGEWGRFGTEIRNSSFGTGDNYLSVTKLLSTPIILDGVQDMNFGVILKDDFSNMSDHTIFIEGSIFKK